MGKSLRDINLLEEKAKMLEYDHLFSQMKEYYDEWSNYDEYYLRKGIFDGFLTSNELFYSTIDQLRNILMGLGQFNKILEIGPGTGFWTDLLIKQSSDLTLVDFSRKSLEQCKKRFQDKNIVFIEDNIFNVELQKTYDMIFFSFLISHVPQMLYHQFFQKIMDILNKGGIIFIIDSSSPYAKQRNEGREIRYLKDGSATFDNIMPSWNIIKHYYNESDFYNLQQYYDVKIELKVINNLLFFCTIRK